MLIPLREQLRDPVFRKWMAKPPKLKVVGANKPWIVYVQKEVDGGWALRRFQEYGDAYRFIAARINDFPDLTLNCGRQQFKPPIIVGDSGKLVYRLPQLQVPPDVPHIWCPYCRRLSIFKSFSRHHALRIIGRSGKWQSFPIRYIDRCMICGNALQSIKRYR